MAAGTLSNEDEEEGKRERFLVLMRHGIAEDPSEGKADEDRSLTPEGHARMKQIARGLERAFPKAQVIYSSPLLRAVQTALWISKGYRSRVKVQTSDALIPGADAKELVELVAGLKERRIILVGHETNLSENLMDLVGLTAERQFELKKGGCYGIRVYPDGSALLEWLLSPRILRKLGESRE
ncbi:MAG TPA: phosphoglycerate mutase family protein [Thermoanaerobaculia bacterium]|nr:phosphoglycerate mutase family protein [Thermoanaerobaculia bacterium]